MCATSIARQREEPGIGAWVSIGLSARVGEERIGTSLLLGFEIERSNQCSEARQARAAGYVRCAWRNHDECTSQARSDGNRQGDQR
jgi:hypothetical protein